MLIIWIVKKLTYKGHFRKFHDSVTQGHPQYIYGETKKKYKTVGLTSHPQKGEQAIKLDKNPEPNNFEPTFIHKRPFRINKKDKTGKRRRNKKLEGWKLAKSDLKKVKKVSRKKPYKKPKTKK